MSLIASASKVKWNEIQAVGLPTDDLRFVGENKVPRTFLCRGEYSIFTSAMFNDGSGFADELDDPAKAWAVVEGF